MLEFFDQHLVLFGTLSIALLTGVAVYFTLNPEEEEEEKTKQPIKAIKKQSTFSSSERETTSNTLPSSNVSSSEVPAQSKTPLYDSCFPPEREFPHPSPIDYYHCEGHLPVSSWYEDGITAPPSIPFGKDSTEILDYFIDAMSDRAWSKIFDFEAPHASLFEQVIRYNDYFFLSCVSGLEPIPASFFFHGVGIVRYYIYPRYILFRFRRPGVWWSSPWRRGSALFLKR